uniref:Uncharacterized protein n=1 Tax=Oryza glumipatula TaxID=40148 RepID=A0A0E0B738_9ORYZ
MNTGFWDSDRMRRNMKTNEFITVLPVFMCVILVVLQGMLNHELNKPKYQCSTAAPASSTRRWTSWLAAA